ncbi:FAD-dependent oxidoreductase [Aeromicrobium chenweiae]|uniref:NADH:flavin oxidoreductase n=1 Tax=Aeromicrobium chenweiae TaxID=2079793 RepID=A0A2S0WIS7_9ACTN|nr:FAD-dependent oxidoreductase [Aeromicrobium chenweiae]AWB91246.1 NADH:flavin oxidoreductase [Aeromicrobium chenweiae]TGN31764.1 FAD-dependent oxidoreductase [Aeromicrobium chenweiae]
MKLASLFSPLTAGQVTLPNRIVMAAMSTGLADERGWITDAQIAYYAERARGGVGLVVVEFACVASRFGISEKTQVTLDDDGAVPGHARLVAAIKAEGAVAGLQLQMPGQFAAPRPGLVPIAPSDVRSRRDGSLRARGLGQDEVEDVVASFARAAARAVTAGYDVIELHGAHGYLLHAFMSPAMNHRDDAWGGDLDRRLAFPRAVISAVKAEIGDRPLLYRLSAEDYMAGGLSIEDMVAIAPLLVAAGVDGIDVSTGSIAGSLERTIDPMSREGWRFDLARRIKEAVEVPVAGIGTRWPETAEAALEAGDVDLIALGRPLLADPAWAAKARGDLTAPIRPCTSCNWCADRVFKHEATGCAENPRAGRELVPLITGDVGRGRRIVVVGGGPGGMAAAIQADSVGFDVILFERAASLGGGLIASAAPPDKQNLLWYRDYLVERLQSSAVDIRLGVEATADLIVDLDPFAVIQAQGTTSLEHGIPGDDGPTVHSAYDLLLGDESVVAALPGPAVVYGGGETGCETAELLAVHGLDVALVTRSRDGELSRAAEPLYRKVLLGRLRANPRITLLAETHLTAIGPSDVGLTSAGESRRVPAATVVLAQGRRSNTGLHAELTTLGRRCVLIGDAAGIARIGEAVHQAHAAVRDLAGTNAEPAPA